MDIMRPLKEHNREKLKLWKNGKNTIEVWTCEEAETAEAHSRYFLTWDDCRRPACRLGGQLAHRCTRFRTGTSLQADPLGSNPAHVCPSSCRHVALQFLSSVPDPWHFGGGSGSGSADPCLSLMDPDPDSDPAPGSGSCYFRHWQDASKKII